MTDSITHPETRIALFQRKEIRRTIHNNEWWFVVVDVVAALSDAANPTDYLNKVRRRDPELAKGYGQIVHPLPVQTAGGRQNLNCANAEGLFRIIQSIPSPKAEPFKRWLAKVGYERIQEIEDPEIARTRDTQGFPENEVAAHDGGTVAGNARRELEKKSGRKVVTSENYLALSQSTKKARLLTAKHPRKKDA